MLKVSSGTINLGFKGMEIGSCLNYLLEVVLDDPMLNKKEELIKLAKTKLQ